MTKLFYREKPIIGLDISTTGIKVMAIDAHKWLVLGYGSIDLDPAQVKESLDGTSSYLGDNVRTLISEKIIGQLPSNHVAIGIPTARTYSRTFTLPLAVEKNLHDAVELEAEQYIPIPVESLYLDTQVIERSKTDLTVLMSAVPQSVVDTIVDAVENASLTPILIEPSMSAVARMLTAIEDGSLPTVVVDIGPASTDIGILDNGFVRVTGSVAIGGNTFTLDIAKKLSITLENAHQLKVLNGLAAGPRQQKIKGAIEPSLQKILAETRKVMRYYNERVNGDWKLEQLLVVGSGSNIPGIGEYFTDSLVIAARVASPWQRLDFGKLAQPAKQFRARYISAAGLASIQASEVWQ